MRVPLSWLREFCATSLAPEEIADLLTNQGVEVDDVRYPWAALTGITVATVLDVRDHPNADKLCVATIDPGAGEREVVVGVRNMSPGDRVPYAPPGATLPGFEGRLERREIRGATSDGMLCSPKELAISADHGGILVLPPDLEPGQDLKETLGLDDAVLDIEVFPNRPDLLSVVGVAREVAAGTGQQLTLPDTSITESDEKAWDAAAVDVRDAERCPRYLARVITGVRVATSPLTAQVRLTAAGMRPVSNVVDATNYVLLEMGQPMHPFDLHRLAGGVVVRRAEDGEGMLTLDGVERQLSSEDLLIADHEKGVGIAGVVGSEVAEVGEGTTDVLLESASFQSLGILRTARRLGLRTEASVRFERGADPEVVAAAAARAAQLIAAWAGGSVLAGAIDVGEAPARRTLDVRSSRASLLIGMDLTAGDVRDAFDRLGIAAREEGDRIVVEVPGWRGDLEREADLIEEVARMAGYGKLPSSLPGVKQAGGLTTEQRLRRRLRDALVRAGVFEASLTTFVSERDASLYEDARRDAIRVANPISAEDAVLRTGLLPGLLRAAQRNLAHRNPSVRLFEVGRIFLPAGPTEDERVGVLLAGDASPGWPTEHRRHDFLDAKGVLAHLFEVLGVAEWTLGDPAGAPYHPGRSAAVILGGEPIGHVGEIHPRVWEGFDLAGRAAAFELRTAPLIEAAAGQVAYDELSRFPPVHRDLAFVVDGDVAAGRVRDALVDAAGDLLDRATLFDVFEGDPVPAGRKSLAFALDFRAPDRTLTDDEVEERVAAIRRRLADELGAELRTG
ncbi:MAG TPA: phenylalanine--tRNA ligase subunit beta [Actinomycetota bacterium]|nr:phenylalanine--tRNA ligase subunit beta [Actinomycetota bacterium]